MRILVCGGRDFIDYDLLKQELNRAGGHTTPCIIQGGATGADFLAKVYAREYGLECIQFNAEWRVFGKRAGFYRNQRMLDEGKPKMVMAFPGGNGTADMVRRAKSAGVHVVEIEPRKEPYNQFRLMVMPKQAGEM